MLPPIIFLPPILLRLLFFHKSQIIINCNPLAPTTSNQPPTFDMTKRQRSDDPSWWPLLRDDVVSNGGFVHSDLKFLEEDRALTVTQKVVKDEVVLKIPERIFMTKNRALSMCKPWLEDIITTDAPNGSWKNSTADIAIAIAMASCRSSDEYLYLHSLPESSAFDALPRRWSEEDIQKLLAGTSLLRHVKSAKTGAREDYNNLRQRYQKYLKGANTEENTSSFPSFEKFSDMLAAVTSRAFQIGTTEQDVAIVPMLDLGNHTRGKSTSKLGKKNVSYQYDASKNAMIVTSTVDIDPGESIRLTYGAKANAQLLLNYGFCIPNNIEPDGSSNDILEFRANSSLQGASSHSKSISLRAGPKSYTYGGFVAALEDYFASEGGEGHGSSIEGHEQTETPNDFEDFLNECENEEEDDDDYMGLYGDGDTDLAAGDDSAKEDYQDEIEALKRFRLNLVKLSEAYNSECLSIRSGVASSELYSKILCMSELRTIFFFVQAIDKVQHLLLVEANEDMKSEHKALDIVTDPDDLDMIDKQTSELASAFMSIRHGIF